MTDKTVLLGEVHSRLLALGYAPTSAVNPGARGHRIIDDPAAILCAPDAQCGVENPDKRSVLALTVTVRDKAIRAAILAVFAKHGVAKAPVRIASDGSETYIVRQAYGVAVSRVTKPAPGEHLAAVALDGKETPNPMGVFPPPTVIRLSGAWRNGDLLSVAHDDLPKLDNEGGLFREIEDILLAAVPKTEKEWGLPKRAAKRKPEEGEPTMGEPFVYKPEGFLPNDDNRRQFHVPDPAKGRARA
jgi:hypothetical protein